MEIKMKFIVIAVIAALGLAGCTGKSDDTSDKPVDSAAE
jgi:hypothetical protein